MNNRHIISAVAVLALGGIVAACSHDFDNYSPGQEATNVYNRIFVETFGEPAPNHNWGFDAEATPTARVTRAISVGSDLYNEFNFPTEEELAAVFPNAIPDGADEIKDLTGDLYAYYSSQEDGHNYKITATGEVSIGGTWDNKVWGGQEVGTVIKTYNVYVDVDGDVTLKRNGAEQMNLFVLRGNVTLANDFGECSGIISVAEGATLNDGRDHLAHNNGIKVYNRGTYNATNTTMGTYQGFDIGNFASFYNEATFTSAGPLTYSAGAGNTSYFYNRGEDVALTAPAMILNSTCHFFTDGTVNISGETAVTQRDIVWVNNGHYTTGSLRFSAQNCTFYNYCQLIVIGNTKFLDGEFNMMQNSYAEMGTGLFDNFIVNMYDNSGINIKEGSKWGRQADGTYQGFRAVDDEAVAYVRLDGQTYVPSHNNAAFHVQGANLTLAYNDIKYYKNYNEIGQYSDYNSISYWEETNAEALAAVSDGNITWNLHNVTNIMTGDDFANADFTVTEGQCAATWGGGTTTEEWGDWVRIIAEDLSVSQRTDFDFNDVVFDVRISADKTKAQIKLKAAGGTLPLTIGWSGAEGTSYSDYEVHNLYGVATNVMVNTHARNGVDGKPDVLKTLTGTFNSANDVKVMVQKRGEWTEITAHKGEPASKIQVKTTYRWCDEREDISNIYNGTTYSKSFIDYVADPSVASDWYE